MTSETDDQLARRLLGKVLDGEQPWTPDMRLRVATVAHAYASLAIVEELRRSNEDRADFYSTMLEFLEKVTADPYETPKGEMRCPAMRGDSSWDQCVNPEGHHGLHVDEAGNAFSEDKRSLRSGQPVAASGCRVCGRPERCDYPQEGLTREQWNRHHDSLYDESRSFNADDRSAMEYANREMSARFGPCPEES